MLTSALRCELEKTNALFHRWEAQQRDVLHGQEMTYQRHLDESQNTCRALLDTNVQLEAARPLHQAIKQQQEQEVQVVLRQNETLRQQQRDGNETLAHLLK
ncbi:hypothetical protein EON64_19830, partial [archaeon]